MMSDIETLAKALCASAGDPSERWEDHRARAENVLRQMRELKARIGPQTDEPDPDPVLCDCDEYIDLCVGVSGWRNKDGGWIVEDDLGSRVKSGAFIRATPILTPPILTRIASVVQSALSAASCIWAPPNCSKGASRSGAF
jgi:hypothetical protein